jgi:Cu2+-containing amine oxidase
MRDVRFGNRAIFHEEHHFFTRISSDLLGFFHLRYAIYDLRVDGKANRVAVMDTPSPRSKGLIWCPSALRFRLRLTMARRVAAAS